MSDYFTSNSLIRSVKRRSMMPENQATFTDEDFLEIANEEIKTEIVPEILRLHEDYLMITTETPLENNINRYSIPHRAIGNKLRELSYKDVNGDIREMTRIGVGDLPDYNGSYSQNRLYAYYIENNEIVLVPNNVGSVTGSLRFSYYLRPNQLVTEDKIGIITDIDSVTGELSLTQIPDAFSTNQKFDIISSRSPHRTLALDISAAAINATTGTITFSVPDLPHRLEEGDHVCIAEQTIIPQIPSDLHSVLAHKVAMRCQEAMGDTAALQLSTQKERRMEDRLTNLIDNRVEDAPQKIVNRHGLLRSGLYRRKYKYRG